MKKRIFATLLAIACVLSMTACADEAAPVSEPAETPTSVESPATTETSDTEEVLTESDTTEELDWDINGIWQRDKFNDEWIEIWDMGQNWRLVDNYGVEVMRGEVALVSEYFELRDENGECYIEVNLSDPTTLFDETYQQTYTKVDDFPEIFPGVITEHVGFGAVEGDWIYQQSSADNTEDYENVAYVSVLSDGTYEIRWLDDLREAPGVITIDQAEYPDGTVFYVYNFYEGGNNFWLQLTTADDDPDLLVIGQEGTERMIRNIGEGD